MRSVERVENEVDAKDEERNIESSLLGITNRYSTVLVLLLQCSCYSTTAARAIPEETCPTVDLGSVEVVVEQVVDRDVTGKRLLQVDLANVLWRELSQRGE